MMQEKIDVYYQWIFIGLFLLMLIPFVILFLYDNPSPEDFYYAHEAKIKTLWQNMKDQYRHGTGRYFQNLLLYMTPAIGKPFLAYKVVCFSFLALLISGILVSSNLLAGSSVSIREKILISLTVLFAYLYAMPQVSSGLYWYGGLSAYSSGLIMLPFFFQSFVKSENSSEHSSRFTFSILTLILLIAIIGINEIIAILLFSFTLLINLNSLLKERKVRLYYVVMAIFAGIFLYILFKSPGNEFRLTQFPGNKNFYFSIESTLNYLYKNFISWILRSPLPVCSLIVFPVFIEIARKREFSARNMMTNPFVFVILWLGVLFVSIFFSFYSTTVVLSRTSNFIYLIFLAGWFYFLFAFTSRYLLKRTVNLYRYRKFIYPVLFVILCLFMLKQNNVTLAITDLFSGSAYSYNSQMKERYKAIEECTTDSCRVDSLINIPKTIYYKDITSDPSLLSSQWYATFFGKKSIALKMQNY